MKILSSPELQASHAVGVNIWPSSVVALLGGFGMRYRLALALMSSLALAGCAQTSTDPNQASVSALYNLDTPIEQLAANKEAASVLRKDLPGLLEDKHYPMFSSMSLRVIAALSNGDISAQTLAQAEADLRSVRPMIATAALK